MNSLEFQTLINLKYLNFLDDLKKNKIIIDYIIDIKKLKVYITAKSNKFYSVDIINKILDVHKNFFLFNVIE